jgi:hypothetical protein
MLFPTLGIPSLSMHVSSDSPNVHPSREQNIQALCDEFITFFEKIHRLDLSVLFSRQPSTSVFKSEAFANTLLSSRQSPRLGYDEGTYSIEGHWRLATLLHICCTYLDGLDSPVGFIESAMRYERKIRNHQEIWEGSAEMLHAIVAKDEVEVRLENPEISWKVSRLLSTTERLSPFSNTTIQYLLASSVSGECSTTCWESLWDTDRIRMEILQASSEGDTISDISMCPMILEV